MLWTENVIARNSLPEVSNQKVFWKYAADLQENTHGEVWFH